MKKVIIGVAGMILLLLFQANFAQGVKYSAKNTFSEYAMEERGQETVVTPRGEKQNFTSKSSILIEAHSGEVLAEKNSNEKLPIASMVKIMTALTVMEEIDAGKLRLDEKIIVSQTAAGMGGSQMFLDANAEYSVADLLKGVIVVSANDACVALAERISGNVDGFVLRMNEKASEIGMSGTHFVNCTGLPGEGQYSTAADVAKMSRKMMSNDIFSQYSKIWLEQYTHPSGRITEFTNTNKLIRFYKDCDGGKTGFTNEAMFCLSAKASKNGLSVISVVIGSQSSQNRFDETVYQFNKAFGEYENKSVVKNGDKVNKMLKVKNGKQKEVAACYDGELKYFTNKNQNKQVEIKIEMTEEVKAPIKKGDVVGKAKLLVDGKTADECNIICGENAEKATFKDKLDEIFGKLTK